MRERARESTHRVPRRVDALRAGTRIALSVAIAVIAVGPSGAGASVSEDEVKAAFLLNFTRYVDWPASTFAHARAPFVICVLGDPEFASTAAGVIGDRTVEDRPITVSSREGLESATDCHILFLPASQSEQQELVITEISDSAVLTVSDSEGFAQMGGVANFRRAGTKLRLEINREAAAKARLKVSARLLRIADVVG
jgi:hypothetical protein